MALPTSLRWGRHHWTFRVTRVRLVLLAIALLGLGVAAYRLVFGLGASTHLNDRWPWGLWVWWDVLTGVALAGGGYSTALLVNFLGRERWKAVERGAFLTSLIGYVMVCGGLLLDLGRWFDAWRPLFSWNPHSVMFELFWCVSGYTVIQLVEFGSIFTERVSAPRLRSLLLRIYVPVLTVGIILPFLHQSALGSLFIIDKGRLDPLWWSLLLPLFFVMSSFFVGPAMVTVENALSSRAHGRRPQLRVLGEMARVSVGVLSVYFVLKVADLVWRGQLTRLGDGSAQSDLFLLETIGGVLVPIVLLLIPRIRRSLAGLVTASSLVVVGVALNRADVVFTALAASAGGASYIPEWTEFAVTFGLVAVGLLAYLFVVENFPVYPDEDVAVGAKTKLQAAALIVAPPVLSRVPAQKGSTF